MFMHDTCVREREREREGDFGLEVNMHEQVFFVMKSVHVDRRSLT
jgi:hypothetical protein